jgi:hypothetical protein
MTRAALAASLRTGITVSLLLLAGCSSTATFGTHRLRHEWSLFGICGPYSWTRLEDASGEELLSVTSSTASPDRQWLALFDSSSSSKLYLLDAQRDALRTISTKAFLWGRSARWSRDGSRLAILAGGDPTRLCVVTVGLEPSVEWPQEDPRDPAAQPVFFHCRHGKDRTGTMAALYRIEVDGWTNEEAIEEMLAFGYHTIYQDLIDYVRAYEPRGLGARR